MEVSQFTYFQQVCGIECAPVAGELTYGLERLAMYVQGVDNVYDLNFNGREGAEKVTYGDVFLQAEQEYSRHNFEYANTEKLFRHFEDAEAECQALLAAGAPALSPLEGEMPGRAEGVTSGGTSDMQRTADVTPPDRTSSGHPPLKGEGKHRMVFPAYDQCIKASHAFNLLDARGVISVTERQSYILRVRNLAKACGEAFLETEAGGLAA
jgi:glycyl-tRNA synthetase alpha chain